MKNSAYSARLDRISAAFSFLCLVHCVVLPVFVTTLPFLGHELMENIYVEMATIGTTFLLGGIAIWRGYRRHHHSLAILAFFLTGITLIVSASFIENEKGEKILKIAGAGLIITAHVLNWRSCRKCANCEECHI